MSGLIYVDPDLGRVLMPPNLARALAPKSFPGAPTRGPRPGEIGVFFAKQFRPVYDDGVLRGMELIWASITANERVDAGADYQSKQVHGGGGTPGSASATNLFQVIAVASAVLTKTKTDQSLGSATSGVTTNEFTTIGLSRAAATLVAGNYTAPASLGAQFAQLVSKQFSATGTGTAQGAGIFNSATVAGSILYVEDNFATSASVVSGDTLTVNATINN